MPMRILHHRQQPCRTRNPQGPHHHLFPRWTAARGRGDLQGPGGYHADHPRSGYAMKVFDQVSRFGPPVSFAEAKTSLETMLDEMDGYARKSKRNRTATVARASITTFN